MSGALGNNNAIMHWKKMPFILALSCLTTSCKNKQGSITHKIGMTNCTNWYPVFEIFLFAGW